MVVLKFRTGRAAGTAHVLQEIAGLKIVTSVSTTATVALGTARKLDMEVLSQTGRSSVQHVSYQTKP